jgi:hypothetical protein
VADQLVPLDQGRALAEAKKLPGTVRKNPSGDVVKARVVAAEAVL